MTITLLSQNDPRWKNVPLGFSTNTTIGSHGCLITAIAMKYGLTPVQVNELLKGVDGFADSNPSDPYNPQKNLVRWFKLAEVLGVEYVGKYAPYNNDQASNNLPCIVEVRLGGTQHFVLYTGNQKMFDPLDGKEKPTSTYPAVACIVLKGETKVKPKSQTPAQPTISPDAEYIYQTLNLKDIESMKVPVDMWYNVMKAKTHIYMPVSEFDDLYILKDAIQKPEGLTQEQQEDLKLYAEMKVLGYSNINDINKAREKDSSTILDLRKENAEVKQRNATLAGIVQKIEEEDSTTAKLGLDTLAKNIELQNTIGEVAKITGVDKADVRNIVSKVFELQDIVKRFTLSVPDQSDSQSLTKNPFNFLLRLFFRKTDEKEVKTSGQ